jgi:hypothetical protein
MNGTIRIIDLISLACDLQSDNGENPEYDRALNELIASASGLTYDEFNTLAHFLRNYNH